MAFNISYVYQAIDKFSSVSARINKSVERTRTKFRRLSQQMQKTKAASKGLGGALGGLKTRLVALGAIVAGAAGVSALVGFDRAMSKVKAISGATGEEFKKLRNQAKELGATTIFSASKAAGGMEFLARAGFKTTEILEAMPDVLNLAAANSMDLASAADITSNIMKGFRLEADQTARVVDAMSAITSNANTNIMQLGDGMKFAAPIAKAAGQSMEMTAAAIGVLSDAGIQGGEAGTGLRRVYLSLATKLPKYSKQLAAMGIDVSKINPETNDLVSILDELSKVDFTLPQLTELFEVRGAAAFSVLVGGRKRLRELNKVALESNGLTKEMAKIMKDNLFGAGKAAISAIEGLIITLGDIGLTRILRALAFVITFVARTLNRWIETFPRASRFIGTMIAVLIGMKLALMAYTIVTKSAAAATVIFNAALFANPIGLIVLAFAALVAIIVVLRKEIAESVTEILDFFNIGKKISDKIKGLFGFKPGETIRTMKLVTLEAKEFAEDPMVKKMDAILAKRFIGPQLPGGTGVAAQAAMQQKSIVDTNVIITAPPGAVESATQRTSGTVPGDRGLIMATP